MREAFETAVDLWKLRLRMRAALRDPAPDAAATGAELDRLVAPQIAYWKEHPPLGGAAAERALRALNERSISAFVVSVRGRDVRLPDKPAIRFAAADEAVHRAEQRAFRKRALRYRAYLEAAVRRSGADHAIDFALDVNDIPADDADLPIFGFQKKRGAHNLLLPDVDFFHAKWYREDRDAIRYEDKRNSACFVGSSTGAWHSVESILAREAPRLRAAARFHGNPRVDFRIANAVHCLTAEAKACLTSQPWFSAEVGWNEQLGHRFLISMDGNGAACSRLVKGLRSNGAVIKYDSPYELYWFPALRAGADFLLARDDEDVERFVATEAAAPGTFREVADAGRRFAAKYLTIRSVMDYTARLLAAYAALPRR